MISTARGYFKFLLTKMSVTFEMAAVGNPGSPQAGRVFVGSVTFNLVRALTFAKTTGVLTKSNSERQTTFNLLKLEENIVADLAMAKASTFPVPLERSVSIHRILALQPFTILELILAQLNVSPSYMQPATLNNSLKHIQWLSHPPFQPQN